MKPWTNRRALLLCLLQTTIACQTLGPVQESVALSEAELALFRPCAGEGTAQVRIARGEAKLLGGTMDWIVSPAGDVSAEMVHPLGGSLVRLDIEDHDVTVHGTLAARWPLFGHDDDDFLVVKDQWLPLKVTEAACLFSYRFPSSWRERLTGGGGTYDLVEDKRRVHLEVTWDTDRIKQSCATISWRRYWGLWGESVRWCIQSREPTRVELTLPGKLNVEWWAIDG